MSWPSSVFSLTKCCLQCIGKLTRSYLRQRTVTNLLLITVCPQFTKQILTESFVVVAKLVDTSVKLAVIENVTFTFKILTMFVKVLNT